jgi:hypothetical protein
MLDSKMSKSRFEENTFIVATWENVVDGVRFAHEAKELFEENTIVTCMANLHRREICLWNVPAFDSSCYQKAPGV